MLNPSWVKWITVSIQKHFETQCIAAGFKLVIEGTKKDNRSLDNTVELRIDGPYFREDSKDNWLVKVEINTLLRFPISRTNYHHSYQNIGITAAMFAESISIMRYGSEAIDDGSYLECLQLITDQRREPLTINNFGQVDPTLELIQASIEGHYTAQFTTN